MDNNEVTPTEATTKAIERLKKRIEKFPHGQRGENHIIVEGRIRQSVITLRLDKELHDLLVQRSKYNRMSLNRYVLSLLFKEDFDELSTGK